MVKVSGQSLRAWIWTLLNGPPPNSGTLRHVDESGDKERPELRLRQTTTRTASQSFLNSPSTSDLFENNFLFCASGGGNGTPNSLQQDYALQLFGTLCAAFNRSADTLTTTLANSSNW